MSEFADAVKGATYPCAVCEAPAVMFTPPDREGRRRWCGQHFDRLALETLASAPSGRGGDGGRGAGGGVRR